MNQLGLSVPPTEQKVQRINLANIRTSAEIDSTEHKTTYRFTYKVNDETVASAIITIDRFGNIRLGDMETVVKEDYRNQGIWGHTLMHRINYLNVHNLVDNNIICMEPKTSEEDNVYERETKAERIMTKLKSLGISSCSVRQKNDITESRTGGESYRVEVLLNEDTKTACTKYFSNIQSPKAITSPQTLDTQ